MDDLGKEGAKWEVACSSSVPLYVCGNDSCSKWRNNKVRALNHDRTVQTLDCSAYSIVLGDDTEKYICDECVLMLYSISNYFMYLIYLTHCSVGHGSLNRTPEPKLS